MLIWIATWITLLGYGALERIDIAIAGLEEAKKLTEQKKCPSFILEHLATLEVHGDAASSLGTEVKLLGFPRRGAGRILRIHLDSNASRKNYLVDKSKEPNPKQSKSFLTTPTAKIAKVVLLALKSEKAKDVFAPFQNGFFGLSIGEEQDSRGKFLYAVDVYSETSPDILRFWLSKTGKSIADALIPGGPTTYSEEPSETENLFQ